MNKTQELDIVRAAAYTLGADSYLGPWIDSVADELEALIQADLQPTLTLAAAHARAAEIVRAAEIQAAGIVAVAQAEAERIEKKADDKWNRIADTLYRASQAAVRELNS